MYFVYINLVTYLIVLLIIQVHLCILSVNIFYYFPSYKCNTCITAMFNVISSFITLQNLETRFKNFFQPKNKTYKNNILQYLWS